MVEVNTTAAREHVPEIERRIRTIKERVRSVISDFPFNPVPMLVLVQTVYTICLCLMPFDPFQVWIEGYPPVSL